MRVRFALGTTFVLAAVVATVASVLAATVAPRPEDQMLAAGPLAEPADTMTAARSLADGSAPTGSSSSQPSSRPLRWR